MASETPVQMAQRHCDEQEGRIVQQNFLIARLKAASLMTEEAEEFLLRLKELLAVFQKDRDRLLARN